MLIFTMNISERKEMNQSIFIEGEKLSIDQVLKNKDQRAYLQQEIFQKYPHDTLLDIKLNIPGPIKNNSYLENIFYAGISELEQALTKNKLPFVLLQSQNQPAGCENFYLLTADKIEVKKVAIEFEDSAPLNRLFDADVLVKNKKQALSRSEICYSGRKCFLCKRPAKDCARSRRHSVQELQNYISNLYKKTFS